MAAISAALVKELREKSGAGMMDCKKALVESGGELEVAVDWLRKNGLAAAAKKAGRVAAEGLVGVATEGRRGAVVEVNAETDFVARNETFQEFVRGCAQLALESAGDIDALKGFWHPQVSNEYKARTMNGLKLSKVPVIPSVNRPPLGAAGSTYSK